MCKKMGIVQGKKRRGERICGASQWVGFFSTTSRGMKTKDKRS